MVNEACQYLTQKENQSNSLLQNYDKISLSTNHISNLAFVPIISKYLSWSNQI